MPKHLLPIPHRTQKRDGDCLAACVAMVLDHLEQPIDYGRLLQLLKTLTVSKGDFELAWLERDYYYAVITM